MFVTFALMFLAAGQTPGPPPAVVPDAVITTPRPDSVWCIRNTPRAGSRVRRTECRTHAEWVAVTEVRQDQANNLYRQDGRYLMDSEIVEAVADAAARDIARRRARQAAAQAGS